MESVSISTHPHDPKLAPADGQTARPKDAGNHESSRPTIEKQLDELVLDPSATWSSDENTKDVADLEEPLDAKPWSASDSISSTYYLSPSQSSMIDWSLTVDSQLYSCHHAFSLPANADIELLKRSWEAILGREEVLRTSFHPTKKDGLWVGAIHKEPAVEWNVVDLCYMAPPDESLTTGQTPEKPVEEKAQPPVPAKKPFTPKKTSKAKTKARKKTPKYVDKRAPKDADDFMNDPSLYESFDRKILTDEDTGRLNLDSGTFWDVPSAEDEMRDELQRLADSIFYSDAAAFAGAPVRISVLRNEEQVIFLASCHQVAQQGRPVERIFEDLWRLYSGEAHEDVGVSTPFWLNRIRGLQPPTPPPKVNAGDGGKDDDLEYAFGF